MKEVYKGIFIGDRQDGLRCLSGKHEIGSILTVDIEPLCYSNEEHDDGITLKHVTCLDDPDADMLSYFDECNEFIETQLKKCKVLVHCFAGVSRSTTVLLAFRMKTQNLDLNKALDELKTIYPKANPNPGFLYQLELFEAMGKQVDVSNSLYKQFRLQIVANDLAKAGYEPISYEILKDLTCDTTNSTHLKQKVYKCRKCRYRGQLFKSSNCLQHVPGTGEKFLPWYKKPFPQHENINHGCTSYFVEPLKWMESLLLGTLQGKLSCPKCSGRIGSFNWSGEQCSCGTWVTPAFQLHKSRIDEK